MEFTEKNLKIAFLTAEDPKNKSSWSGTNYSIARALQKHCGDVQYIGPINTNVNKITGLLNRLSLLITKKGYEGGHSTLLSKRYAQIIKKRISKQDIDLIFAPAASAEIAYLETEIPVIYISDTTFHLLQNYYGDLSNVRDVSLREGNKIEKKAIKKSVLLIYSSRWAAESAIKDYGADKSKVHVLPFGANIEYVPLQEEVFKKKRSDKCRLLFLGVDWERKGGSIAFDALLELEKLGVESELTVCGCVPPEEFKHESLMVIPFLDKNDEKQGRELNQLLLENDFLILPTRGDCTPVVFCEANAFGLPVITTDTGGISSVICNGKNGYMLPLDAGGKDFAQIILEIYSDDEIYSKLIESSRKTFDESLNWDVWAIEVKKLIKNL